jgi:hypothetical protein
MTGKISFQIVADDRHAIKHLDNSQVPKTAYIVVEGDTPSEIIGNAIKIIGKTAEECYRNKEKYNDVVFSTR